MYKLVERPNCYNSRLSDKSKEKPGIKFIQENLIEFQV